MDATFRDSDPILQRFDLLQVGLAHVRAAYARGEVQMAHQQTLALVRQRLVAAASGSHADDGDLAQAEGLLLRRLSLLNYPPEILTDPMDWLMLSERDDQWTQHLGYFKWSNSLARAWRSTGRREFASAWRGFVEDLLNNCWYGRFDWHIDPARPRADIGRRVSDNGEATQWNSLAAATRIDVLIEGAGLVLDSGVIDDPLLLRLVDALWRDAFLCIVNNPRSNTPNQYLHTSISLLRLGLVLPEHGNASAAYELGWGRLRDALARQVLPDGADLEQSTNYNYGILRTVSELAAVLPPDLLAPLRDISARRLRFLAAVHYPDGFPVEIAKNGHGMDQRELLAGFAAELGISAELTIPGIALPYGGWYVLRSAWGGRQSYLLLKACEPGVGHVHEDSLGLVLWCGARRLLIDSGHFSYGSSTDLDRRMNAYCISGASHSSVQVDGHGPRRVQVQAALRGQPWEEPRLRADQARRLPNRAHAGPVFALVEGVYADGYGPQAIAVRHHRRVLQVENRGWLVIDRLTPAEASAEHAFELRWMLPPTSVEATRVENGAIAAPGLRIHPLLPVQPMLRVCIAQEEPAAGWYCNAYGQRQSKPDVVVGWTGRGPQVALTWLADDAAPAVGSVEVRGDGLVVSVHLTFADAAALQVSCAPHPIALQCGSLAVEAELLAVFGADAVALGTEGLAYRQIDRTWHAAIWPLLPELTP